MESTNYIYIPEEGKSGARKYEGSTCSIIDEPATDTFIIQFENGTKIIAKYIELYTQKDAYLKIKERRINVIKDLYKDHLDSDTIDTLASIASMYGGTVSSRALLDLYDSLIYGEEPKGPNQ